MKKLILGILALTLFIGTTNAQTPVELISKAKKAIKAIGGKKEKLKDAETAVEEMMKASENQSNWEALLWKGKLYNEMASIDNLQRSTQQLLGKQYKAEFTKAGLMASDALLEALKGTQDKKQIKEITSALSETQVNVNNNGSDLTDAKDYVNAYKSFKSVLTIHDALKANGVKSTMDKADDYNKQLYYTALLSTYSEMEKDAMPIYEKLIAAKKDTSFIYSSMYKVLVETDRAKALTVLEEGAKKYPEDTQILFTRINHYLKDGKLEELITQLKEAIKKEPKNATLYSTLGNVLDNLAQSEKDEAKAKAYAEESMVYFNKTLEIDGKNVDAIYSIGASFYNKAANFSKEMKKLESDFSKEGQKKYEAAEKAMIAEFDKALPYFQKAESINPNDRNTLIALKEIFARKNDLEKTKEFKARFENVENGGKNKESYFKQ
ncbi:MAG: hypothetical protein JNL70_17455 [Saprospiraceae bacterium]|nr:hypothetical protein [Saprospiraceae bacterium]